MSRMSYDDVLAEVDEQVHEIGKCDDGDVVYLVKPRGATEKQFERACRECGFVDGARVTK